MLGEYKSLGGAELPSQLLVLVSQESVFCQAEAAVLEGKSGRRRERKWGSCSVVMSLESSRSQQSQSSTFASSGLKCVCLYGHASMHTRGSIRGSTEAKERDHFQLLLKC